jgi:hypothetical protein
MLYKKLCILGTEYEVHIENQDTDKELDSCDGYCDKTIKRIVVTEKTKACNLGDFGVYQRKIMRHEITHAFLFESGLHECWDKNTGHDETMVDWIACMFPKMKRVFEEAGCLE